MHSVPPLVHHPQPSSHPPPATVPQLQQRPPQQPPASAAATRTLTTKAPPATAVPCAPLPAAFSEVLKPHQLEGFQFLRKHLAEEVSEADIRHRVPRGVVLAHSMGLGKSLTVLTYLLCRSMGVGAAAARAHPTYSASADALHSRPLRILLVVPKSLIGHWIEEHKHWIGLAKKAMPDAVGVPLIHFFSEKSGNNFGDRMSVVQQFMEKGGILILGYEQLMSLSRQTKEREGSGKGSAPSGGGRGQGGQADRTSTGGRSPLPGNMGDLHGIDFSTIPLTLEEDETLVFGPNGTLMVSAARKKPSGVGPSSGRQAWSEPPTLSFLNDVDIVVFDEAHRLKNSSTQAVRVLVNEVQRIPERIALTGTPLQNHLSEYGTMLSVVRPGFIDPKQFDKVYSEPIAAGRCSDSSPQQRQEMHDRVGKLQTFLSSMVHRRGVALLEAELPPRMEFIVLVQLKPSERRLYTKVIQLVESLARTKERRHSSALSLKHIVARFLAHPSLALLPLARLIQRQRLLSGSDQRGVAEGGRQRKRERDEDRDDDEGDLRGRSDLLSEDELSDAEERDEEGLEGLQSGRSRTSSTSPPVNIGPFIHSHSIPQELKDFPQHIPPTYPHPEAFQREGSKLEVCLQIIAKVLQRREKVVVFSAYRSTLLLLQHLLTTPPSRDTNPMQRHIYLLTGSTEAKQRTDMVRQFNAVNSERGHQSPSVFLCTTQAGGVGLNLTAANHCILFDGSWNPADDSQATFRIYRYGQTRPSYIYRLVADRTAEDIVLQYGLRKEWVSKKLVDLDDPRRLPALMWRDMFQTDPQKLSGVRGLLETEKGSRTPGKEDIQKIADSYLPALSVRNGGVPAPIIDLIRYSFLLRDDDEDAQAMQKVRIQQHEDRLRAEAAEQRVAPSLRHREGETGTRNGDGDEEKSESPFLPVTEFHRIARPTRDIFKELIETKIRADPHFTNVLSDFLALFGANYILDASLLWYQEGIRQFTSSRIYAPYVDIILQGYRRGKQSLIQELLMRPLAFFTTIPRADLVRIAVDLQWIKHPVEELYLLGLRQCLSGLSLARLEGFLGLYEQRVGPLRAEEPSTPSKSQPVDRKVLAMERIERIVRRVTATTNNDSQSQNPLLAKSGVVLPYRYTNQFITAVKDVKLETIAQTLALLPVSPGLYKCPECRDSSILVTPTAESGPPQIECRCGWSLRTAALKHRRLRHGLLVAAATEHFRIGAAHLLSQPHLIDDALRLNYYGERLPPPPRFTTALHTAVVTRLVGLMSHGDRLAAKDWIIDQLKKALDPNPFENLIVGEGSTAFIDRLPQVLINDITAQCGLPNTVALRRQLTSDPAQVFALLLPRVRRDLLRSLTLPEDVLTLPTELLWTLCLNQFSMDEEEALESTEFNTTMWQGILWMGVLRETLCRLMVREVEVNLLARVHQEGSLDALDSLRQLVETEHRRLQEQIVKYSSSEVALGLQARLIPKNL
jgi:SNF2 family DNA or RNA helicase